ncbi:MAG: cyclic peptide export ABC transporter [Lewinellaceae bacterium]|nr:cyclic peptide export ABC transporter [Phaeodactylibacter sp.]MCB9348855.1 cyclic peptide export ABC transporter [Lewinellaceae bacterium]
MKVFTLLKQEINPIPYRLIVFGLVSGLSSALLISVVNSAAETISNNESNGYHLIVYTLGLGVFFFTKRYTLDRSSEIVELVANRIRYRLADKIRLTELTTLEKYGAATIYARISQDVTTVSNISMLLINAAQELIVIIFILFYIAAISFWSFGLIIVISAFGVFYYTENAGFFYSMFLKRSEKQVAIFARISHVLQGFNEININRRKNEEVFEAYTKAEKDSRDVQIKIGKRYNVTLIIIELLLYMSLGLILFALPKIHVEHSLVITKVVAAVIFIVGPLSGIVYTIPLFGLASDAAGNIIKLEAQLEEELQQIREQKIDNYSPAAYQMIPFESQIVLKGLSYQYPQRTDQGKGFQIGPFDFTFRKGDLIFVTGGNGSGKSTFLKLLTGLYKPKSGQIKVDGGEDQKGRFIYAQNYQQYQNLFSIIFSDYHLFDKIYGLEQEVDPDQVNTLLQNMGLPEEKTTYRDGAFTNIMLSSGQKKRLALTTVLLEDKPIYVFDEVAADLDPEFRDKFYFEIIQELKARNKTVFVVSHDQQYWNASDRLIQFQDGQMRELSREEVRFLVKMVTK